MQIVRAKPSDAATLTQIAFAAKRHWSYPERWIEAWKEALTISAELIATEETYAAVIDGQVVGFNLLVAGLNRMSLEHLWVLPSAMGQGVGRALFEHAIERAKETGAEAIEIESDPNAQEFYERMGARLVSTKTTELEGRPRIVPVLIYEIRKTS